MAHRKSACNVFCALQALSKVRFYSSVLPIRVTMTAFCACRRFSASSKISFACASNTLVVISYSRYAGRQCWTMQPGFAAASSSSLT